MAPHFEENIETDHGGYWTNGTPTPTPVSPLKTRVDEGFGESADMLKVRSWTSQIPQTFDVCVHHMIQERIRAQPEAPAICAWDGQLSYGELDTLSSSFAAYLVHRGVRPEVYVPIISEKSRWVPVAMLAVLKAGGAFVLLDPSHPVSRLEETCQTIGATNIVASKEMADTAARLARDVILTNQKYPENSSQALLASVQVRPGNVAYSVFTSGTSGKPKGAVIEHRAFSSSAVAHARATDMDATSRVLQFASYAFDACLTEMLTALIVGACVCIPSEVGRTRDLAGEARRLQPNWAILTPSVTRILDVRDFPMLRTLVLGGEAIHKDDVHKWAPHVSLFVAYGLSECAVANVARPCRVEDADHATLGHGVGVTCWVVDPDDHNQLSPVGAVGELLLDGPAVGRGYINDPTRTAQAFIESPPWHRRLRPGANAIGTKLYKTGDLVAYNTNDGSVRYVGRKDSQTKFHGQRLEVDEIEHHLRRLLPATRGLIVDIAKIGDEETLIAFILQETSPSQQNGHASNGNGQKSWLSDPSEDFRDRAQHVQQELQRSVPKWMIPSIFLPLKSMPLMPSGKSDRRQLRSLATSLTRHQLQAYAVSNSSAAKRQPSTSMEEAIQKLWANVLRISPSEIGLDDSFFDLGGNSINAMKLAGAARQQGLKLAVSHVYGNENLAAMAASVELASSESASTIQPFSLLPESEDREAIITRVIRQCQLRNKSEIEDVYPCTPLQEGLMSLTARRPGAYTVAFEYELPVGLDVARFQRAWNAAMKANPILRTRIIQANTGAMYQAVIRGSLPWDSDSAALDDWKLGKPLARLCLRQAESSGDSLKFIFALHHAISDGWALQSLLDQVQSAYEGAKLSPRPFNRFIDYISRIGPESETFWKSQFADLQAAAFPALPSAAYTPNPTVKETITIPNESPATHEFNVPNRLKLAWGILISLYTDSLDTVFGVTVAGRGAPVLGIEEMTGPTIASVPCRLRLHSDSTIVGALRDVQKDSVAAIPFEQAGLQHISRMGPEAASACRFQSLLVIQPEQETSPALFSAARDLAALDAFSTYAITLICRQSLDSVVVEATFDPDVINETQFKRMMNQLRHLFLQLNSSKKSLLISDLNTTSPEDMSELTEWNQTLPEPVVACAHDLIREQSDLHPNTPAVHAWDGGFTYKEMEELSSNLACYLMEQGVGPEVFIPLCFEKSRWTTIAMLGVIKAGGAFILLDPSHPAQRLQGICRDSKALFVISSERNAQMARNFASRSIVLGNAQKPWIGRKTALSVSNPLVSPENSVYAVYTSGSTGTPKGAVHSHISWCTSAQANRVGLYLGPGSRVLQFAAYAFDISIADNLLTLVAGGCICVPSEQHRQGNIVQAINELDANWACLTPSVARIIDPNKVAALKTLVLCGEPIASEVISLWSPHAHLLNLYGPAECAILTTLHRNVRDHRDPNNIAYPTSAVCWVVDTKNEEKLAPIGTVGELLVESPIVGHGYLNDPKRSAASFVPRDEYPSWLLNFRLGGASRLYRTGDLVQYAKDGSLRYVSRKDTQIKLRGQRIELGEVEYHLRHCFPGAEEAVAEVVMQGNKRSALTAFILTKQDVFKMSDERFKALTTEATEKLELLLPVYMVPTVFLPLNHLPYSKSGKLDRKLLRTLAAEVPADEYSKPSATKKALPASEEERTLIELFAQVLKVPVDGLGPDEHFLRLGGDSILAMNLVALAKDRGLTFTTADIFKNPTGSLLAKIAQRYTNGVDHHIPPFSLLPKSSDQACIVEDAVNQCQVKRDQIEDIYPCTPLQEGLMALAAKTTGMYIARFKYEIPRETDLARFQKAWDAVVSANSILRTRIIQSDGIFQVVLKESPSWDVYGSLKEQTRHSETQVMGLGSPLVYLSLAPLSDGSGGYRFLWTVHHSLYDGVSEAIFLQC